MEMTPKERFDAYCALRAAGKDEEALAFVTHVEGETLEADADGFHMDCELYEFDFFYRVEKLEPEKFND